MSDLLKDLKLFTPYNQLIICTLVIIFPYNAFPFPSVQYAHKLVNSRNN